jgi:hypothetical protein
MSTKIATIDPKEFGLETKQVETIEQAFAPKIAERDGLAEIYSQIIKKELTQSTCDEAGDLRRKLVKVRTGIADIHKTQKAFFLAAGRFVDAWKNKETAPVEQMEENLAKIEKHFILIEQERIAKLESYRTEMLSMYTEIIPMSLGLMQEDVFTAYLNAQKEAHKAKIEAEKKAEQERIAAEKAEAAERERVRLENEALRKAAIEREKEIEAERAKAEKERIAEREEAARKQKAIEDAARIEREKIEAERAKIEAELRAKQQAELKVKQQAEASEKQRIEAEKQAAKAPDREKLVAFVNSIVLPELPSLKTQSANETMNIITAKFNGFKAWANSQITNL